jgi:hypothetical protein
MLKYQIYRGNCGSIIYLSYRRYGDRHRIDSPSYIGSDGLLVWREYDIRRRICPIC